ncbi:MAG: YigZ family protein [Ignavibacteriales bacterium]|nr:YigZ family protein [Ignavibacteriales bacterium]
MSDLPFKIKTIALESEFRIKEKGSLFIGLSIPVKTEEEGISFLNSVKKNFYDATHHCFSYKLADGLFKYSDDGEPNGTAGIRINNAQNHFELTNIITIVVRYFGGVKLGVGSLGKAYYEAAIQNLEASKKIEKELFQKIEIEYQFEQTKYVHHLISKFGLVVNKNLFELSPVMHCSIKASRINELSSELNENYNPKLVLRITDNLFYMNI